MSAPASLASEPCVAPSTSSSSRAASRRAPLPDQARRFYTSPLSRLCKSKRGTEVTALFYSLIETARLRGEDPGHCLRRAALAAIENPSTVTLPKNQA